MAPFSIQKASALHLTSFLLSVLLQTIITSQSVCSNFDSYCKNHFGKGLEHVQLYDCYGINISMHPELCKQVKCTCSDVLDFASQNCLAQFY